VKTPILETFFDTMILKLSDIQKKKKNATNIGMISGCVTFYTIPQSWVFHGG